MMPHATPPRKFSVLQLLALIGLAAYGMVLFASCSNTVNVNSPGSTFQAPTTIEPPAKPTEEPRVNNREGFLPKNWFIFINSDNNQIEVNDPPANNQ